MDFGFALFTPGRLGELGPWRAKTTRFASLRPISETLEPLRGLNKLKPKRNPQTCWKPQPVVRTLYWRGPVHVYVGASLRVIGYSSLPVSPLKNGFGEQNESACRRALRKPSRPGSTKRAAVLHVRLPRPLALFGSMIVEPHEGRGGVRAAKLTQENVGRGVRGARDGCFVTAGN